MQSGHSPSTNRILASLPPDISQRIGAALHPVPLFLGAALYESGKAPKAAYFPTTATVSLHYVTASGESVEMASVGREGMVGVNLVMGGTSTPSAAVVVVAGHGLRLDTQALMLEFAREPVLRSLLLRYTQGLLTQMSLNAVCHRHHTIENQLSRWLLHMVDRHPGRQLVMTQELLAGILGVRRESVTEVAGRLQSSGSIGYRRGHIEVLDRSKLEHRTCECYGLVRRELDRLVPEPEPLAGAAMWAA